MNDESIYLPLFPTSSVIVPYGSTLLAVNSEPYIQLFQDCIKNETPFFSVYSDNDGIYKVGCACEIINYKNEGDRLICQIYGHRRVSIISIVSIIDGMQRIDYNGKQIFYKLEEPMPDLPYQLVNGEIYTDNNNPVREDIKEQVYEAFKKLIINKNKEVYDYFVELTKEELIEGVSYFILDQLVEDNTEEGNALRYEMLTKQSETKRLRMLRNLICPKPA